MKFITINKHDKLQIAIHMHKHHHGVLPNCANEMVSPNNTTHTIQHKIYAYNNQLSIPKRNTNIIKQVYI